MAFKLNSVVPFSITTDISTIQFGENHIYPGKEFKSYRGSNR